VGHQAVLWTSQLIVQVPGALQPVHQIKLAIPMKFASYALMDRKKKVLIIGGYTRYSATLI
jgi:hypothetical protein